MVVYNNCGGERYANFIRNVGSTVFRDVPKDELLRFNNHLLNYGGEAALDDLVLGDATGQPGGGGAGRPRSGKGLIPGGKPRRGISVPCDQASCAWVG